MKRVLVAAAVALPALAVGALSGLGTIWLTLGTAMAAGFGWMLGGLPPGKSDPNHHIGNGGDGGGSGGEGGNS